LKKISVAIVALSKEQIKELREEIGQTGVATVMAEVSDYCTSTSDWATRQLVDAEPELIVIDIGESAAGLQTLQVIHTALPNARLLVTSSVSDPQLIIELMRAGVREFLPSPLTQDALLQAFNRYIAEKVRSHRHTQTRSKRGKLYCMMSAKHGSGATTVAVNLAGIIAARSGQRTALIDLDRPLGDAAAYLNVKPNFTVTDALAFDHVIIDLPTNVDEDQVKVLTRHVAATLVVLTPELPAIWRTERLLTYLTGLHAADKVRIILNRSTRSDEISDADIERLLRMPLYCKLPNEYGPCIKAINSGTLLENTNTKQLNKSLVSLASDIAGLPGIEGKRGLFGMLLKPSMGGTNA